MGWEANRDSIYFNLFDQRTNSFFYHSHLISFALSKLTQYSYCSSVSYVKQFVLQMAENINEFLNLIEKLTFNYPTKPRYSEFEWAPKYCWMPARLFKKFCLSIRKKGFVRWKIPELASFNFHLSGYPGGRWRTEDTRTGQF